MTKKAQRKLTGTHYTPSGLVELTLTETIERLLVEAIEGSDTAEAQEKALLAITVCEPCCGGGAFMLGAARRIAGRLVDVRHGAGNATVWDEVNALWQVISDSIYGMDLNPLAVELAKVALAVECFHPSLPVPFFEAHLKVGNGLLGATPKLIAGDIPDAAFTVLPGDDPKWTATLKARNKREREAHAASLSDGLFEIREPAAAEPTTSEPYVREPIAENYFAPNGVQLVDPDLLTRSIDTELAKVTPASIRTLVGQVAYNRWLVGWSNALVRERTQIADDAGTASTEDDPTVVKITAEYDRVNKVIDADPLRHFDVMMFTDGPESDAARDYLAFVLAHLAHAPGGVAFAGMHWCAGSGHRGTADRTPCDAEVAREVRTRWLTATR